MIGPTIGPSSQCWQPMLAVDIGPMIDWGLVDNCGPRITAKVKPMTFQIYNNINNDNKIYNLAYY